MAKTQLELRVYRRSDLTKMFGVCDQTIDRMVARGDLPKPQHFGKRIVFWPCRVIDEILGKMALSEVDMTDAQGEGCDCSAIGMIDIEKNDDTGKELLDLVDGAFAPLDYIQQRFNELSAEFRKCLEAGVVKTEAIDVGCCHLCDLAPGIIGGMATANNVFENLISMIKAESEKISQ